MLLLKDERFEAKTDSNPGAKAESGPDSVKAGKTKTENET
jgi:hypothetical protein